MRIISTLVLTLGISVSWAHGPHQHGHFDNSLAHALKIGSDTDGKPLYLCLAHMFNSVQPGKTWVGSGRCNVAYGGKEYIVDNFKIPESRQFSDSSWQNNAFRALAVGKDTNGEPLFLCQAYFKGSKQPGKTWPGYRHCNISYAGQEIIMDNFKVLGTDRVTVTVPVRRHQGPGITIRHS